MNFTKLNLTLQDIICVYIKVFLIFASVNAQTMRHKKRNVMFVALPS